MTMGDDANEDDVDCYHVDDLGDDDIDDDADNHDSEHDDDDVSQACVRVGGQAGGREQ